MADTPSKKKTPLNKVQGSRVSKTTPKRSAAVKIQTYNEQSDDDMHAKIEEVDEDDMHAGLIPADRDHGYKGNYSTSRDGDSYAVRGHGTNDGFEEDEEDEFHDAGYDDKDV
ncbi:hypothetical protein BUE80_DR009008 [Diplocarpon rosae]|nr:hypothetical protein BUE80_DR009008 [Diplocarpon rosae]